MTTQNKEIDFAESAKQSIEKSVQKQNVAMNINGFLQSESVQKRLKQLVGENAAQWTSTILQVAMGNEMLRNADPKTIVAAAIQSITLGLPLDKNLGFAYIVPYKTKDVQSAQFQIGYKGFVQLAMRSGQYKTMNVVIVYEGQLISSNMLTGEIEFDKDSKTSDKVLGYAGYFRLNNGFEKTLYMTKEQVEKHAKRFSQTYKKGFGLWTDNFDDMALKTVIKLLLSKWGILSVEMQKAVKVDQSVSNDLEGEEVEYVDNVEIE